MTLTSEVGGIKRTEDIAWPRILESRFGLKGFTAYTTEHGFTTVILPTGKGIIVRYKTSDGDFVDKATPQLLAYCMCNQACRTLRCEGDGLMCVDGKFTHCDNTGVADMYSDTPWIAMENFIDEGRHCETIGQVDRAWVAEQINQRPELLEYFSF